MNIFLSILYSFRSLRFTIAFGLFGRSHLLRFESKLPILVIAFEMCCVSKNACVAVGCKSVRAIRQSEGQLVVSQKHRAESWSFLSLLAYMFMQLSSTIGTCRVVSCQTHVLRAQPATVYKLMELQPKLLPQRSDPLAYPAERSTVSRKKQFQQVAVQCMFSVIFHGRTRRTLEDNSGLASRSWKPRIVKPLCIYPVL